MGASPSETPKLSAWRSSAQQARASFARSSPGSGARPRTSRCAPGASRTGGGAGGPGAGPEGPGAGRRRLGLLPARRAGPEASSGAGAAAGSRPAPYERRVRWLREIQSTLRERRPERARQLLRLLRQAREGAGRPGAGARGGAGGCGPGRGREAMWSWPRRGKQGGPGTGGFAGVGGTAGRWGLSCLREAATVGGQSAREGR